MITTNVLFMILGGVITFELLYIGFLYERLMKAKFFQGLNVGKSKTTGRPYNSRELNNIIKDVK